MGATFFGLLWEWFWYGVPWWAKLAVALAIGFYLWRVWRVPPKWLIAGAAITLAALGYNQAAQRGWRAKEQRDMRDADKLIEKAHDARIKAERIPVEKLRDPSDPYLRD